jgi:replication-associated recombination protein RarA
MACHVLEFAPAQPQSLTEKYQPRTLSDFAGLAKPKQIAAMLTARPYASSWIFRGDSGTGKTTMALAIGEAIGAEIHRIASQECTVQELRSVVTRCYYEPLMGHKWSLVLTDEADTMSKAAQDSLLSTLDKIPPRTIFIWTCNSTEKFEARFLSRSRVVEFSNYGIQPDAVKLLTHIWEQEAPGKLMPNVTRLVKEANGNVRAALMALEMEMLLA